MWVTKWFLPQGQWEAVLGGVVPELHTDRLLLLLCSHKSLAVCLVSLLISLQICVWCPILPSPRRPHISSFLGWDVRPQPASLWHLLGL